jgi:hypothetical protein
VGAQPLQVAKASTIGSKAAEVAFLQFWNDWLLRAKRTPATQSLAERVKAGSPSHALRAGSACRALVLDRWGPVPPEDALIHGGLAEVAAVPRCWELVYDSPLSGGLVACVDARQGHVLLVWRTPGG